MARIFDNIELRLGDHLQATLKEFDRMNVAVGYFNLRGWNEFDDIVAAKEASGSPVARVLIGMVSAGPEEETLDQLQASVDGRPRPDADAQISKERKLHLLEHLRVQLMRGVPTTIFHRQDLNSPIMGFVGSSNLTAPGLNSNLELNVDVPDSFGGGKDLASWFEARWNDPHSRVVTADLLALLDESWVKPKPPHEVFLKLCYDLSRDVREGQDEYSVPLEVQSELLDYQATAVRRLARRIVTRGGTKLSDVVRLGKTIKPLPVLRLGDRR